MKAIVTKYYGATNTRGSRIVATAEGGKRPWRISIPYDHSGNEHAKAALALAKKMGWKGELIEGGLPNGDHVFVFSGGDHHQANPVRPLRHNVRHNNPGGTVGENRVVSALLRHLRAAGFSIRGVWDGEEMHKLTTDAEIKNMIFNLDESSLRVRKEGFKEHGILLVTGNASSGEEIISDWNYTTGDPDGFNAAMDAFNPLHNNPRKRRNPAPRIGTRNSLRRSQATGKRPSRRLVARRRGNVRKGYFPNPSGGVRIVHNKLLGGWYIVRGPHQTPISGRFGSKEAAQAHLRNQQAARDTRAPRQYLPRGNDYPPHDFQGDDDGSGGECSVCGTGIGHRYHQNPRARDADPYRYVLMREESKNKWEYVESHAKRKEAINAARAYARTNRVRVRVIDRA